jgi:hypothetical protein
LPPVQQGREFHSLDTTGDSETEKQPVEMSLHGSPRHLELHCNFGVVTTLQQQFDDLLFARAQPNSLLLHPISPFFGMASPYIGAGRNLSKFHSTHIAILRRGSQVIPEPHFPQGVAGV